MAGESEDTLPEELHDWVDEQAAASDVDAETVLSRAVTLYRLVEEHATASRGEMPVDALEDDLDQITDRLTALDSRIGGIEETVDSRVGEVEDDLDEKITDVRERVIQVKRETDSKASADHDHEEIRDRLDSVETRLDTGFDNYEEILSYLTEETGDLDTKLTRLAQVVVSLRRRTTAAEQRIARMDAVDELKQTANRHGDRRAKCERCGGSVTIGLLTEPACPHCESGFVDVEPSGRLFGSATLTTGRPPALMPGDDPNDVGHNGQSGRRGEEARSEKEHEGADERSESVTELFGESKNA